LLAYWTVDLESDGRVAFKPDVYGYDAPVLQALNRPSPVPALDLRAATGSVVAVRPDL
jgi:murein L,D-transpeptidase YcbB/YkuD